MTDTFINEIRIDGADQAEAELNRVGEAGERAFNRLGSAAAGDVNKTTAEIDKLGKTAPRELKKVEDASRKMGERLRTSFEGFSQVARNLPRLLAGIGAAAAAAGVSIFALSRRASQVTSVLKESANAAGTTAETMATLGFALEQSGSNAQSLQRIFARLAAGGGAVEQEMASLGVQLTKANGDARDGAEVFREVAEKIALIRDPAQQAAVAARVFGRRLGPELVELLSQGSAGIDTLVNDARRLGLVFAETELKVGKDMGDAVNRLNRAFGALSTRVGLAFGPGFIKLFDELTEAFLKVRPYIEDAAVAIGGAFTSAVTAATEALGPWGVAIAAGVVSLAGLALGIGAIVAILSPFANLIRLAFLPITAIVPIAIGLVKGLGGAFGVLTAATRVFGLTAAIAFGPWGIAIAAVTAALGFLAVTLARDFDWSTFAARAMSAWTTIESSVSSAVGFFRDAANSIDTFFADLWNSIAGGADAAWSQLSEGARAALQPIVDSVTSVITRFQDWFGWIGRVAGGLGGLAAASAAVGAGGFAGGGSVHGPGTSTSDSIPAWLSKGEWVIRAAAVKKYGSRLFHMLNSMSMPRNELPGFAMGGIVNGLTSALTHGMAPLKLAGGGMIPTSPGRPMVFNLDGERISVRGDEDSVEALMRVTRRRRMASAGRAPSWKDQR